MTGHFNKCPYSQLNFRNLCYSNHNKKKMPCKDLVDKKFMRGGINPLVMTRGDISL